MVVEVEVNRDLRARFRQRVVGMQVDMLVLDRLSQPLHEDVVAPATLAVHADPDVERFQRVDEARRRELGALVGVHDLGYAVAGDRLLQRLDRRRLPCGNVPSIRSPAPAGRSWRGGPSNPGRHRASRSRS